MLMCRTQRIGACILFSLVLASQAQAADPTTEPLLRLETGMHTAAVRAIAVDLAERYLVTASSDKTARVWDLASGKLLTVLRPPTGKQQNGKLYTVAISPNGATIALGGWTSFDEEEGFSVYLFDPKSGRMTGHIANLPNVITTLRFSPNGNRLALGIAGKHGVRLVRTEDWKEFVRDSDYGDSIQSADFDAGGRLVTTSEDGYIRLYDQNLRRLVQRKAPGGRWPYSASFSPDGTKVAVGFSGTPTVNVLAGDNLRLLYSPKITDLHMGDVSSVQWSQDGEILYAAGTYGEKESGVRPVLRWADAGRGAASRWRTASNTILALQALSGGRVAFAAADPAFGILDADGRVIFARRGLIADFRYATRKLRLSPKGNVVETTFFVPDAPGNLKSHTLQAEISESRVVFEPGQTQGLQGPDIRGELEKNWRHTDQPMVRGKAVSLDSNERSRSLAFVPGSNAFVLGTEWNLRFFDDKGNSLWHTSLSGIAWTVNVSADGRYVVAGLSDGTLRWYSTKSGAEVLALFPYADHQRWIAWTPEGYFDASPGAEELIGYHRNRGYEREGEFVTARQLWETFYQPGLIAHRLDADGEALQTEMVRQRGDVRQRLTAVATPQLELLSAQVAESDGTYRLRFRIKELGQGTGRLVLRVDGLELAGRWQAPTLTPGGVVELPLDLAEGLRNLTVELVDGRGVGSKPVRTSVQVRRPSQDEVATLHVLGVGVTNYRDGDLRRGVAFAAGDARAIVAKLKVRGALLPIFKGRVVTETLVDENATVAKIDTTLKAMVAKARPEDVFVLFMAGHGTTLEDEYYFMPWDLDYENDAALRNKAISQTLLREWQSWLPTRSLLLLDTCRAGSAMQLAARTGDDKNALAKLIRVSQRNVIVATSADRIALEGHEGHGVFSWAVLDALSHADYDDNGRVDVTDIATHVRKHVPAITEQKFKYRQVPMQDTPGEPFAVAVPELSRK